MAGLGEVKSRFLPVWPLGKEAGFPFCDGRVDFISSHHFAFLVIRPPFFVLAKYQG